MNSDSPTTPEQIGPDVASSDLLGAVTAKTVDFDMEMWKDQDSSCLLCNAPLSLGDSAEWPDDPRLLLCWGCMSELCSELIGKLEAPNTELSDPKGSL